MYFNPSLPDSELDAAITKLVSLAGLQFWEGSISKLAHEARYNPFAAHYFAERFEYEIAMAAVRQFRKTRGRVPGVATADAKTMRLYSFAAMLSNVFDRLPLTAQKALTRRLQGALRDDKGIYPIAYELTIASHLMQKGANVDWRDWDAGGFDFLIRKGNLEAEVECKTFSADIGRKVHRTHHFQLGGLIHKEIGGALDRHGSIFVDTLISDRLEGNLTNVATTIRGALASGEVTDGLSCKTVLYRIPAGEIPFDPDSSSYGPAEITGFVEKRFGYKNPSLLVMARKGHGIAILSIRSQKADEVTGGIYKQLKRGTKQFSGTRPALLCAHMLDMRPTELVDLHAAQERGEPTGFNFIATRLFQGDRPHLHTLLFTTPGLPRTFQTIEGNTRRRHYMESGLTFQFTNNKHPQSSLDDLNLFS